MDEFTERATAIRERFDRMASLGKGMAASDLNEGASAAFATADRAFWDYQEVYAQRLKEAGFK